MSTDRPRLPHLEALYEQYLSDKDSSRYAARIERLYTVGTLERLAQSGGRMARRGAVFALGLIGTYEANDALGRALKDGDRGVRQLAENALRAVWCRAGNRRQQEMLSRVVELNGQRNYDQAILRATELIDAAPWFAEAWNQRAIAYCGFSRYAEAIHDCHQALEVNPYHFAAAAGMGHCYLQLGNRAAALECFRRALRLNPELEGVRAQINSLERAMRRK